MSLCNATCIQSYPRKNGIESQSVHLATLDTNQQCFPHHHENARCIKPASNIKHRMFYNLKSPL